MIGCGVLVEYTLCNVQRYHCPFACYGTAYQFPDEIQTFLAANAINIDDCWEKCQVVNNKTNACVSNGPEVSLMVLILLSLLRETVFTKKSFTH